MLVFDPLLCELATLPPLVRLLCGLLGGLMGRFLGGGLAIAVPLLLASPLLLVFIVANYAHSWPHSLARTTSVAEMSGHGEEDPVAGGACMRFIEVSRAMSF